MVRVPDLTEGGLRSGELVEFVDIFPTLVEAAGFPALDICPEDSHEVSSSVVDHRVVTAV